MGFSVRKTNWVGLGAGIDLWIPYIQRYSEVYRAGFDLTFSSPTRGRTLHLHVSLRLHWQWHRWTQDNYNHTFSGQFRRQCMQFGNSAGNFGGLALRRTFGNDSACGLSNLVALLPNSMQIVHNWSEKGVEPRSQEHISLEPFKRTTLTRARPGVWATFARPGGRMTAPPPENSKTKKDSDKR